MTELKIIEAEYISTAGHGFLKVNREDFKKVVDAKNADGISKYSGVTQNHFFLEHDCDAPYFLEQAKLKGFEVQHTTVIDDDFISPNNYYGVWSI